MVCSTIVTLVWEKQKANNDKHNSVQFLQMPRLAAGSQPLISCTPGQSHGNSAAEAQEHLLLQGARQPRVLLRQQLEARQPCSGRGKDLDCCLGPPARWSKPNPARFGLGSGCCPLGGVVGSVAVLSQAKGSDAASSVITGRSFFSLGSPCACFSSCRAGPLCTFPDSI